MSEMGEYWREQKAKDQSKRSERLKWNLQVVNHLSVELGFKCEQHSEYHLTLRHKEKGRFDYWPSTNSMKWIHDKNGRPVHQKTFKVNDIELYLLKHFKN
jgi:hypothetical protein